MISAKQIVFGVIVLLASLISAKPSDAFLIDEDGFGHLLHWRSMPVSYRLVAGNTPGGAAGENAVHQAFRTWTNASPGVDYRFNGYVAHGAQRNDGMNLVYWVWNGWPYDPALAASTFRFYDTSSGRLIDADIVVNGQHFAWSIGGDRYDVENALTHEVGHFAGLGHSADPQATMFGQMPPRETKKRSLEGDDLAALDVLYSGRGVASSPGGGGGGGGCAVLPRGTESDASGLLPVGLLLLGLLLRRRSSARAGTQRHGPPPFGLVTPRDSGFSPE